MSCTGLITELQNTHSNELFIAAGDSQPCKSQIGAPKIPSACGLSIVQDLVCTNIPSMYWAGPKHHLRSRVVCPHHCYANPSIHTIHQMLQMGYETGENLASISYLSSSGPFWHLLEGGCSRWQQHQLGGLHVISDHHQHIEDITILKTITTNSNISCG